MVIKISRDADPSEVVDEFARALEPLGILVTAVYGEDEVNIALEKERKEFVQKLKKCKEAKAIPKED